MHPGSLPPANRTLLRRRLDHLGIGLAGLCAIHCLLTLVVISALGLGGHLLLNENIHRIGLALALGIATFAIGWGTLRHRRWLPFGFAVAGLALMGAALLVPHGTNEFLLTLVGVAIVSAAHWMNLRAAA
jgi:CHASE2 domain-containing sensor protein